MHRDKIFQGHNRGEGNRATVIGPGDFSGMMKMFLELDRSCNFILNVSNTQNSTL